MKNRNSNKGRGGGIAKSLLCVFALLGVNSSDVLAEEKYDLDQVVFSASGFEQEIVNAPASISVITKEELEKKPVKDIAEAIADVPGVDITMSKTGTYNFQIRGFSSSYVLVLVDGKRQNIAKGYSARDTNGRESDFLPPLSMIERIEVIRGPASTLYGSDAVGGVINIITKKNPNKTEASIGFNALLQQHSNKYGNAGGIDAYVATPIIEDTLSISARLKYYDKASSNLRWPTVYDNSGNVAAEKSQIAHHSAGIFNSLGFGTRLNWTVNDKNNVYLDLERYINESQMNTGGINQVFRDGIVLNHDGDYGFGTTNSYVQYLGTRSGSTNQQTGIRSHRKSRFWAGESKVVLPWNLGGYGNMVTSLGTKLDREDLKLPISGTSKGKTKTGQTTFALYGENEYFITDNLIFTLGLRYIYSNLFGSQLTPRAYFVYHINENIALRGGVAKGYSVPQARQLSDGYYDSTSTSYTFGNPNLKPEKSINYELGVNFNMPNFGYSSITGFITNFDNQIGTDYLNGNFYGVTCTANTQNCKIPINQGKTQVKGVEFALNTRSWYGFSVNASYTFMDNRYKYDKKDPYGSYRVANKPRHIAMLKLNYEKGQFDSYIKARARLDSTTGNKRWEKNRDFYVFDLGINYKIDKQSSLSFSIQNLFDKNFLDPGVTSVANGKPTGFWNHYEDFTEGRSFWISYKHDF